jgi:uncharacterized membrane protein
MNSDNPRPSARIAGHPVTHILVSFPIAFFSGALATDIAYAQTADMIWADFSAWLLAAAMFTGGLAALAGIVDVVANRRVRARRSVWPLAIGSLLVLILGLFDNLVHSRDAWTSIVPVGLALSAAIVIIVLITAWLGFSTVTVDRPDAAEAYSEGVRQ